MFEFNENHKQNSKNFEIFRELSYTDILEKLHIEKKINKKFYKKALDLETVQGLPPNNTLTSFVFSQLELNLNKILGYMGIINFRNFIDHNKQQASNTPEQCSLKQEKIGGEYGVITQLIYVLLFRYFKEFDVKGFIPIIVDCNLPNIYSSKFIKKLTQKALTYSKLYYCMYGNYLPIIYCIFISSKCSHAISYLCLPSEDIKNEHDYNGIVIDTAGLVKIKEINDDIDDIDFTKTCINDFKRIIHGIEDGFEYENIVLNQTENNCIVNLQDKYGICSNYSLGIVLNYLFQQDHLAYKVLHVCVSLKQKGTSILQKILLTIGNVSNLFHKFLWHAVFEKVERELFVDVYKLYIDNIDILNNLNNLNNQNDSEKNDKVTKNIILNTKKNISDAEQKYYFISKLIKNLLKNPKPNKDLQEISNFLKECNQVIRLWNLKNLEMDNDNI